jgi:hypothetical protein
LTWKRSKSALRMMTSKLIGGGKLTPLSPQASRKRSAIMLPEVLLQDKQDIKDYHNNFLIINSCKRGNLLCNKLIYYNSNYEEDKAIIH